MPERTLTKYRRNDERPHQTDDAKSILYYPVFTHAKGQDFLLSFVIMIA